MVTGTSFMGLGGPNLVRGATGENADAETLGGAALHTRTSGVAHYAAEDDAGCLSLIRGLFRDLPPPTPHAGGNGPARPSEELYSVLPADHRLPYEMENIAASIFDADGYLEFQPEHAREMLCATARLDGTPVALVANRRGFVKTAGTPRVGGIIYTESARKVSYFVENAERRSVPLIYLQDTSGFMVGTAAESEGIIRAGAEMVESMACARVPKIVLTINHASGAGYYALAGQGFDPDFTLGWPTARIGVMESDSAIQAMHGPEIERQRASGQPLSPDLERSIGQTKADYERWLDATYAAARGHVDAIVDPVETRSILSFLLEVVTSHPRRGHLALDLMP